VNESENSKTGAEGEHNCPRCRSSETEIQHSAKDQDGGALWAVLHCRDCSFTWRTSEPGETIDPEKRPAHFALRREELSELREVIPVGED
jgi:C4-type Zn-finger protein